MPVTGLQILDNRQPVDVLSKGYRQSFAVRTQNNDPSEQDRVFQAQKMHAMILAKLTRIWIIILSNMEPKAKVLLIGGGQRLILKLKPTTPVNALIEKLKSENTQIGQLCKNDKLIVSSLSGVVQNWAVVKVSDFLSTKIIGQERTIVIKLSLQSDDPNIFKDILPQKQIPQSTIIKALTLAQGANSNELAKMQADKQISNRIFSHLSQTILQHTAQQEKIENLYKIISQLRSQVESKAKLPPKPPKSPTHSNHKNQQMTIVAYMKKIDEGNFTEKDKQQMKKQLTDELYNIMINKLQEKEKQDQLRDSVSNFNPQLSVFYQESGRLLLDPSKTFEDYEDLSKFCSDFILRAVQMFTGGQIKRLKSIYFDDGANPVKNFHKFIDSHKNFIILFNYQDQIFGIFSQQPLSNAAENRQSKKGFFFSFTRKMVFDVRPNKPLWTYSSLSIKIGSDFLNMYSGKVGQAPRLVFQKKMEDSFDCEAGEFQKVVNNPELKNSTLQLKSFQFLQVRFLDDSMN